MEGYLAHKWGLEGKLPTGHAYKLRAPTAEAGTLQLSASVSDIDGDDLTTTWSVVSGPNGASFADPGNPTTEVTFVRPGTYILRLTSDDGLDESFGEVTVEVSLPFNSAPQVDAGSDGTAVVDATVSFAPPPSTALAWYDANDAATIIESGGQVSEWLDKSGNNRHATQASGTNRPTYQASDAMMGGMPSIGNIAATGAIGLDTPEMSAQNAYIVTYYKDGLDGTFDGYSTLFSGAGAWGAFRVMGDQSTSNFIGSSNFNDAGTFKNGSTVSSLSSVLPMPASLFVFKSSLARTQVYSLGYNSQYTDRDWEGAYSEIIFTDGTEDLATQQMIEGYLAHQWGLTADLPSDHPYKETRPTWKYTKVDLVGSLFDAEGDELTSAWTQVSGPGPASFSTPGSATTTVTLGDAGTYVFRLTADDGWNQSFDEVTMTVIEATVDLDNDGMDDAWETEHFPGQEAVIDGTADSDGDGVRDFFEYLYGSDPNDAVSHGFKLSAGQSDGSIKIRWTVRQGMIPGDLYEVHASTDLSDPDSWDVLPASDYTFTQDIHDGMTTIELEMTADLEERMFIRLVRP